MVDVRDVSVSSVPIVLLLSMLSSSSDKDSTGTGKTTGNYIRVMQVQVQCEFFPPVATLTVLWVCMGFLLLLLSFPFYHRFLN